MPAFLPVQTDLEPCLCLMQTYYEFDGIEFNATRAKTTLEQMIAGNFGQAHIVRHNHHDVGYLIVLYGYSLEYGGRVLELDELFLIPEARGLGLGRAMLEFIEMLARDIGAVVIQKFLPKARLHGSRAADCAKEVDGVSFRRFSCVAGRTQGSPVQMNGGWM
jgi:GNAT superfamily N-acetyltransferase